MINTTTTTTSTGEPAAEQTPPAIETATAATSGTTLDDATHAAHRKRVKELKKTLVSGSNTETADTSADIPAPATATSPAAQDAAPETITDNTSDTSATPATAPAAPDAALETTTTNETPAADKETAPVPADTTETAPAVGTLLAADEVLAGMVSARNSAPAAPISSVPVDYLANGYYLGAGKIKYLDPKLVDDAEAIGTGLAGCGVTLTAFNRLIKTLKGAAKLPFPAQQGAMKKLLPLALKEKKPLLRELVEKNRAAVQNEADFAACLDHFQDVAIFLAAATQK